MKLFQDMTFSEASVVWGFIPNFLSNSNPAPVREQFAQNYISGWSPFVGFKLDPKSMRLTYPGDPAMLPRSMMRFRTERIYIYPFSWVLVMQDDDTWEICRMD